MFACSGDHFDFFENEQLYHKADGRYSTHVYTERAQQIIEEHNSEKPLFLYMAYQSLCGPMQVYNAIKLFYSFSCSELR